jgi:flagellar hook-associated protein 3 FlgL
MMMQSIGDLARGLVLERQTARIKSDVSRLAQELASGRVADTARHVGGNTAPVALIGAAIARAEAHRTALADLGRRAEVVQIVIASLDATAAPVRATALALGPAPTAGQIVLAATEASGRFADAVSLLNTRDAARGVLAGAAAGVDALATPSAILDGLRTSLGPLDGMTGSDIASAVRTWFAAPSGFAATAWQGDATASGPVAAMPGERIALEVTALDPAFRDTLAGLAIAVLAGDAPDRGAALLGEAAATLGAAADGRAMLAGRIGQTQARIDAAMVRHATEADALAIRRNTMTEADPYATGSALSTLQDRLEAVYAITARLSRLSLADFMR